MFSSIPFRAQDVLGHKDALSSSRLVLPTFSGNDRYTLPQHLQATHMPGPLSIWPAAERRGLMSKWPIPASRFDQVWPQRHIVVALVGTNRHIPAVSKHGHSFWFGARNRTTHIVPSLCPRRVSKRVFISLNQHLIALYHHLIALSDIQASYFVSPRRISTKLDRDTLLNQRLNIMNPTNNMAWSSLSGALDERFVAYGSASHPFHRTSSFVLS